ncbi:MAG: hypothetical protein ABW042_06475 [Phenylobacterium sp.]
MNRRFLLLAGLVLLAGCATAPAPAVTPGPPLAELEPLYALRAGREALTITVASNGCTKKEDFAFFVERSAGAVRLAFGRRQLDRCRSFAQGKTELAFTWAELGVDAAAPVFLLNPVSAWTGPGGL